MCAAECDHGDARGKQQAVPADRAVLPLQARHQIGDGDVQEAGSSERDDHRDPLTGIVEGEVADDAAGDGGQTGESVPEERAALFQPAERRIAKSPASCGTSCAMIAIVVVQPSTGSARKAAAMSRPSVKLWKLSPIRMVSVSPPWPCAWWWLCV